MGLVNTVVGALVLAAFGGLIWGICFFAQIVYSSIPVEQTRGIVCLIPLAIGISYFLGGGIHDYKKAHKKTAK